MLGGASIDSNCAEKQRAFGVIVSNNLHQPLLIRQAFDHHNTYFLDNLGAFALAKSGIDSLEIWMSTMNHAQKRPDTKIVANVAQKCCHRP